MVLIDEIRTIKRCDGVIDVRPESWYRDALMQWSEVIDLLVLLV